MLGWMIVPGMFVIKAPISSLTIAKPSLRGRSPADVLSLELSMTTTESQLEARALIPRTAFFLLTISELKGSVTHASVRAPVSCTASATTCAAPPHIDLFSHEDFHIAFHFQKMNCIRISSDYLASCYPFLRNPAYYITTCTAKTDHRDCWFCKLCKF